MRHKKTAQITFRIDANLKEAAQKAAAQERRSLTSLIEKALAKHLRNRRHLSNRRRPPTEAARTALIEEGAEFFSQHSAERTGGELTFRRTSGLRWKASEQARPMRAACARAGVKPAASFHILPHT